MPNTRQKIFQKRLEEAPTMSHRAPSCVRSSGNKSLRNLLKGIKHIPDASRPSNDYKCLALDNSLRIINHPSTPNTTTLRVGFNQTDFHFVSIGGRKEKSLVYLMHETVYKTSDDSSAVSLDSSFAFSDFSQKKKEKNTSTMTNRKVRGKNSESWRNNLPQ